MSRIKFLDIEISNFLAFGREPTKLNLDTNEIRLILGVNHDVGDEGQSRNGAGKTTILNALVFALYGKGVSDKLKNDDYVNYFNDKKCIVKLRFQKGDKTFRIERGRKPSVLEIYEEHDDGTQTPLTLDSMSNTDEYIQKLIGRSYDVFMVDHFLSPKKESFFAKKAPEQRQIIEEILNLDTLTKRAETLKKIRSDFEVDVKVFSRDIENAAHVNEKIDRNVERMTRLLEEFDIKKEQTLTDLTSELQKLNDIDIPDLEGKFKSVAKLKTAITRTNEVVSEMLS